MSPPSSTRFDDQGLTATEVCAPPLPGSPIGRQRISAAEEQIAIVTKRAEIRIIESATIVS
jgi:hypothetical protein